MIKENESLLTIKLEKENTILTQFIKNIYQSLYELFDLLLNDPIENFVFEVVNISIGYLQMIMYIFNETVTNIFNKY